MHVHCNLDDYYWNNEFQAIVQEKGMEKLAVTITRMCQIHLGLNETITWCCSADDTLCNQIMESLFLSGNFGSKNDSGRSFEAVMTNFKREGLFKSLQNAGENHWKAYKKHSWLKPFCWLYQIFRYAKQGIATKRNSKLIKGDIERSNERYELLKKFDIA